MEGFPADVPSEDKAERLRRAVEQADAGELHKRPEKSRLGHQALESEVTEDENKDEK